MMGSPPPLGTPIVSETICPFPTTALPVVNATTLEECTSTYAQFYGSSYMGIYIVTLVIAVFALGIFSYQTIVLILRQRLKKKPVSEAVMIWFLVPMALASFMVMLGSIDLWGMRGFMSVALYFITDRIAIFFFSIVLILLVDFWRSSVNRAVAKKNFMPKRIKLALVIISFMSTVLAEVLGIFALPEYYYLFSGISYVVFSFVVVVLLVVCSTAIRDLVVVLRGTEGTSSLESAGQRNRESLRRLLSKLLLFLLAGIAGVAYVFAIGIFYFTSIGYTEFRFEMGASLPSSLIGGRVIVWILLAVAVYTFRLQPSSPNSGKAVNTNNPHQVGGKMDVERLDNDLLPHPN